MLKLFILMLVVTLASCTDNTPSKPMEAWRAKNLENGVIITHWTGVGKQPNDTILVYDTEILLLNKIDSSKGSE